MGDKGKKKSRVLQDITNDNGVGQEKVQSSVEPIGLGGLPRSHQDFNPLRWVLGPDRVVGRV